MLPKHETFWSKYIEDPTWCWRRTWSTDTWWYWKMSFMLSNKLKTISSHVYSFIYHNNNKVLLEKWTVVRHTCNNKICCNPKHLILWSHTDNMIDRSVAWNHNRWWQLDLAKVHRAIDLLDKWHKPKEISIILWVSKASINNLSQGNSWSHATNWKTWKHSNRESKL